MLALDVGSSSVRARQFDRARRGGRRAAAEEYESDDPAEVAAAVRRVLGDEEPDATSCFAHSLVAVDEGWNALTPILGWRDTRSADAAKRLAQRLDAEATMRAPAPSSTLLLAGEARVAGRDEPETFRRATWFVSFAEYQRRAPAPETSLGMASTSGLLDLTTHDWDEELLSTLGLDRERLPRIADVPLWPDAACSNAGAGCVTRERAALMVGTSGAFRVLYENEQPHPKPGLFLYLANERRVVEGGALSDGGNLYNWLERTLADASGSLAERDPHDHGLVFLPFLGGERSTGWNPHARGSIHGLTFSTTPLDVRQAAYEGVAFRFAAIADLLPDVNEVVATGGALLRDRDWIQIMADALARPIHLGRAGNRSAARRCLDVRFQVADAACLRRGAARRPGRGISRRSRGAATAVRALGVRRAASGCRWAPPASTPR